MVKFQQTRIDVVVNDETIGRGNAASISLQNYKLFNGLTSYKYYGKIFSVKTTNGIKDLDLIPVRIGTVGYMYDKISGELYGDEGTGTFVLGPDIN